jgi:predicted RNA binding protein YcfA (HicA-like mRNA interferase family)
MGGDAAQKLLERMRSTSSGWGQKDFEHLLVGFGFQRREGKHTIYNHPTFTDLWISIPRHKKLKGWVARDAVKLIDELISRSQSSKEKNEYKNQDTPRV